MRIVASLLCVGIFFAQEGPIRGAQGVQRIRVGETVSGVLSKDDPPLQGRGPSKASEFVAEADGPVTVSFESFDFDAFLRVEKEGGDLIAEDDNGGVETNARVVLQAKTGACYRIVVAAAGEKGAGEYHLSILAGDVTLP
ncbi:MAG TPA: hypothetical protein VKF62_14635, partial [Planctomycetota bacterium]|nr:hypothetical protein [Planctomycetota bacterium]